MLKKLFLGGAILALLSVFTSCEKEDSSHGSMKVHVDKVAATSVTVSFTAETPSNVTGYIVGAVVSVGDPMVDDESEEGFGEMVEAKPGRSDYKITIGGLKPETKYNVRAYILAGFGGLATWGDMKSFTTQSPSKPKLLSAEVTKVGDTFVTMVADWSDNASEITEMGVLVAKSESELSASSAIKVTGWNEFTVSGLEHSTKYYAKAYAANAKGTAYSDVISFTTSTPVIGKAVDLGLSVKWSDINVGATSPEDYGDYFAWGETAPKSYYYWDNYKYCKDVYNNLTKYCTDSYYGTVDNKTVLEKSDDAATVNWGGKWRMPTIEEWNELRNKSNCSWTWTTINGINGYKVQSEKTGYTDNWIFLPAAGCRGRDDLNNVGSSGYYWSSSLNTVGPYSACSVYFVSDGKGWGYVDRCIGQSVRPVSE